METLFHYCSSAAFTSMVSNKSVWLSSLRLSNDVMEGKIMGTVFQRICDKDSVDAETKTLLENALAMFGKVFDGLGFCLSEEGDLLSQWRGYASDGQGFSIGFNKEYLDLLSQERSPDEPSFSLRRVIYDFAEQENSLMPTYEKIKSDVVSGRLKYPRAPTLLAGYGDPQANEKYEQQKEEHRKVLETVMLKLSLMSLDIYTLKNKAFSEEKEWRLISFLIKGLNEKCDFRAAENRLVPYREFILKNLNVSAINKVIIGPKNITPVSVVKRMLELNGFSGVEVVESAASYR